MTPVSAIGILICVVAMAFASVRLTTARLALLSLLLLAHLASCIYFWNYSLTSVSDATSYYFDPYRYSQLPLGFGTVFVTQICYFLKTRLGATYLDCFLLFQSVGFVGVMITARIFQEIEDYIGVAGQRGYLILLFLPSVNFWTAAIGKDAPMFLAVALALWSVLRFRKRIVYFAIALGIMVMFRAHIALMAATALAMAAFFDKSTHIGKKIGLLATAALSIFLVIGPVQQTLDVDVTSVSSVTQFFDVHNSIYATVGGNTSMGDAPYPLKVLGLLFRPLFFDARGVLGVIASIENVGVIIGSLYVLAHWRDLAHLARRVFFIRFSLLYALTILFSLTLVYYNVGLGLRERIMAYPMIFSVLVALWSMRRKFAVDRSAQMRPALMATGNPHRALAEP